MPARALARAPALLALLAPLAPLALAQTAVPTFWGQEAADAFRSSSIRVTTPSTVQQVIIHDLGDHPQRTRGLWPTLPVVTPAGSILMASTSNAMMQFAAPHTVVPDVDPGDGSFYESWHKTREFSLSTDIGILNYPAPSSSAAVDAAGVAYWVNRDQSMLYSWDTTNPSNNAVLWPKINISDRTSTKDGFYSYYTDFSILLYDGALHLPDPNYHAALTVQTSTGSSIYSDTSVLGLANHRLLGSCGSSGGAAGSSVVFTDFGTGGAAGDTYGVFSLDFDGSEVWRGNVYYDPADGVRMPVLRTSESLRATPRRHATHSPLSSTNLVRTSGTPCTSSTPLRASSATLRRRGRRRTASASAGWTATTAPSAGPGRPTRTEGTGGRKYS